MEIIQSLTLARGCLATLGVTISKRWREEELHLRQAEEGNLKDERQADEVD